LPCCKFCPFCFALLLPISSFTFCLVVVDFIPCVSPYCYMFLCFYFALLLPNCSFALHLVVAYSSQFAILYSYSLFRTSP
jgi:hypothetical protein